MHVSALLAVGLWLVASAATLAIVPGRLSP
jgi:hypothetical protein